jgi:Xaa-Pro aminopeptidase
VHWLQDLKGIIEMMTHAETIYINTNEHYRAAVETETREARFVKWWKEKYPAHTVAKATNFTTHSFGKRKRRIRSYTTSMYHYRKRIQKSSIFVKPNVWNTKSKLNLFMNSWNRSKGFAYTPLLVQETMLTYCTILKITNNVNPVI